MSSENPSAIPFTACTPSKVTAGSIDEKMAARLLPDTDPKRLLKVLDDAVGLPLAPEKLQSLTVKKLRSTGDSEFAGMDSDTLGPAVAMLRGEDEQFGDPLPVVESYGEGDLPNSIRVACGSNQGELLDGHFGSCSRFLIYQVSAEEQRLIAIREATPTPQDQEKNSFRAGLLDDCQLLMVVSIGGPAAAKVIRAGVHPIKRTLITPARQAIAELQHAIGHSPPPWLAKVMGVDPQQRIKINSDDHAWAAEA